MLATAILPAAGCEVEMTTIGPEIVWLFDAAKFPVEGEVATHPPEELVKVKLVTASAAIFT